MYFLIAVTGLNVLGASLWRPIAYAVHRHAERNGCVEQEAAQRLLPVRYWNVSSARWNEAVPKRSRPETGGQISAKIICAPSFAVIAFLSLSSDEFRQERGMTMLPACF